MVSFIANWFFTTHEQTSNQLLIKHDVNKHRNVCLSLKDIFGSMRLTNKALRDLFSLYTSQTRNVVETSESCNDFSFTRFTCFKKSNLKLPLNNSTNYNSFNKTHQFPSLPTMLKLVGKVVTLNALILKLFI